MPPGKRCVKQIIGVKLAIATCNLFGGRLILSLLKKTWGNLELHPKSFEFTLTHPLLFRDVQKFFGCEVAEFLLISFGERGIVYESSRICHWHVWPIG